VPLVITVLQVKFMLCPLLIYASLVICALAAAQLLKRALDNTRIKWGKVCVTHALLGINALIAVKVCVLSIIIALTTQ
jgi:predicted Co/Zn/Cd cation transporter (cation efflux family)